MIEILKDNQNNQKLYVDGKCEENVDVSGLDYFVDDQETSKRLKNFKFKDFPPIANISFRNYFEWCEIENYVFFAFDEELINEENENLEEIEIGIKPNLLNWTFFFSFLEYRETFIRNWEEVNAWGGGILAFDEDEPAISIILKPFAINSTIREHILPYETLFEKCHKKTLRIIDKRISSQKIISYFDFPQTLKVPCEQYLLYFAQFLQDLGIKATSSLKEEAGKVLFSVTPTDNIEALDKIREALTIYLKLPESPIVYNDSFAAMRLQQQIENLQHSQRMAARELQFSEKLLIAQSKTVQEKNLTISQQQSVIEQQNKIIEKITSKSIMMDSLENKEELEEIYEGVKVGESKFLKEKLGVHLNPAKAIKTAVKNTFGQEEKKSVLGLEQED